MNTYYLCKVICRECRQSTEKWVERSNLTRSFKLLHTRKDLYSACWDCRIALAEGVVIEDLRDAASLDRERQQLLHTIAAFLIRYEDAPKSPYPECRLRSSPADCWILDIIDDIPIKIGARK